MGNASERKGGAFLDILYPRDGPLYIRECLRPGPSAQLGPLHGPELPAKRLPDGPQEVFMVKEAVADEAADEANTGKQTFCGPTEGRSENATKRGETERLDTGGYVEAC